jgi:O-antigen/teichoic acid export membrane protein
MIVRGVPIWPPEAVIAEVRRRRLVRDVAVLQVSNAMQRALGFGFSVVTARALGVTGYGEYLLVLSLYSTLNLVGNMGVGQFLVVPLAQSVATRDREAIARGVGYVLKFGAAFGLVVLTLILLAGELAGDLIMHRSDLGSLTRVVAIGIMPTVIYTTAVTALQAGRRMPVLSMVEVVDLLVGRGCAVSFVLAGVAGGGVPAVLWGTVVGSALSATHAAWQYRRVAVAHDGFPGLGGLLGAAVAVRWRTYFRFSAMASIDKNVAQLIGQTPLLFLGRFASAEEAAYFGIAGKVFTLLASFHGGVSRAISVRLSQEMGTQGVASTRRLFWKASLVWGGASAVGAACLLAALPVFRWVYGDEYLPSVALVTVLGVLQAKQGLTVALGSIYLIAGRVATNALLKLPILAAAYPLGSWLVHSWGATGAAMYQLVLYLVGDVMYFGLLLTPWFWREARDVAERRTSTH